MAAMTYTRIDRGCLRMLEHAKPDLIQQPGSSRVLVFYSEQSQTIFRVMDM